MGDKYADQDATQERDYDREVADLAELLDQYDAEEKDEAEPVPVSDLDERAGRHA